MSRKVANGTAIRDIRVLAGFSQTRFAAEIGISRQALNFVESGTNGMRPENIKRAAEVLGVPITALLTEEDEPEPVAS